MSKDPIGLQGGLNFSIYVTNPITRIDPLGLQDISSLGFDSSQLEGAGDYASYQKKCVDSTGQYCTNTHRDDPIIDYVFCSAGMPTKSGAGYQNLVTERYIDAPERVTKKKLEIVCGEGYIVNKDKGAIRSDEIDDFLEADKVIKKIDVDAGKKGLLSLGGGAGVVRLKNRSIFDLSQPVAIEVRGRASIVSKKKEKGKK